MVRAGVRLTVGLVAAVTAATTALVPVAGAEPSEPSGAGPDTCPFITELIQHGPRIGMKGAARLYKTKCGIRYRAGQQDSHLVITQVGNKLRFVDRGTDRIDKVARTCHRVKTKKGVAAECTIPARFTENNEMLIEVWPRLGDDFVDGSSLSARFSMTVLGDGGNDTAYLGDGADFFNGAFGNDHVWGGDGDDWLRTGDGRDRIKGGPGKDFLNGGHATDVIDGGDHADLIYCGPGRDRVYRDSGDSKVVQCEAVNYK